MIKVLHVINGADLGGISSFILNYYKQMNHDEFHFDFVMYDKEVGYNGSVLKSMGCKFYTVPGKKHLISYIKELKHVLKEGQYDAIHVHTNTSSYVALCIAKMQGIAKRVAHAHSAIRNPKLSYRIKSIIAHILIPITATDMCACSMDAGVAVFGNKVKEKIRVIPNGIDTASFQYNVEKRKKVKELLKISDEEKAIVFIGRLTSEKNATFAIKVMESVCSRFNNIKLFIIGDGPEIGELKKQAHTLQNSIIFLGQRNDVAYILQGMDLLLMPSVFEGFGMAALEALASGLPVIASENIPHDLQFSNRIEYLPITDVSIPRWTETIYRFLNQDKRDNGFDVIGAGFDIHNCVENMIEVYRG